VSSAASADEAANGAGDGAAVAAEGALKALSGAWCSGPKQVAQRRRG
jgi:hypothetical protein